MKSMLAFEIIKGPRQGSVIALSKKTSIMGRDAVCDIKVEDEEMSRKHCRIVLGDGWVKVDDLGSSNGILVNGNRVDRALLKPGDVMTVGMSQFRLSVATGAEQRKGGTETRQRGGLPVSKRIAKGTTLYHSIFAVLLVMVVVVCIVIALPQYYAQKEIATQNALNSATNLALVLAVSNQEALKAGEEMLVDTGRVTRQEGVQEVFIYDRNGRIFFPPNRLNQVPTDPESKQAIAATTTRIVKLPQDRYDVSEPVLQINPKTGQIEKIGTARITYSTREMRRFLSTAVYGILGSLVLVAGLSFVFAWIIFRMITKAIMRIRDDLDTALKNGVYQIAAHQPLYAEQQLVSVINRCLARIERAQDAQEPSMISPGPEKSGADPAVHPDAVGTIGRMIDEAILVIDGNNRVVSTNDVYCRYFRLESESVIGSHLIDAVVDPVLLTTLMELIKNGTDGSVRHGHASLSGGGQADIRIANYVVAGMKEGNILIVISGLAPKGDV